MSAHVPLHPCEQAGKAATDLDQFMNPVWDTGAGHKAKKQALDPLTTSCLTQMKLVMTAYSNPHTAVHKQWLEASLSVGVFTLSLCGPLQAL